MLGPQSTGNVVEGNFIGSDVTGTKAISNAQAGVLIGGAVDNLIGGTSGVTSGSPASGAANLISSGGTAGILLETFTIAGSTTAPTGNAIEGNLIGTDVSGTKALSAVQPTGIEVSAGVGRQHDRRNDARGRQRHRVQLGLGHRSRRNNKRYHCQ